MLSVNLSSFSANSREPQRSVTPEFHHFHMEFITFCTQYWSSIWGLILLILCEFTWIPTVTDSWIPSFSYGLPSILHSILRLNRSSNGQWHSNSLIFLWNSLHYALDPEAQSNIIFCEFTWIPTVSDTRNLTFWTQYWNSIWGLILVILCEFTWIPTVTDSWIPSFSYGLPSILHSILRLNRSSSSANSPESQRSVTPEFFYFPM